MIKYKSDFPSLYLVGLLLLMFLTSCGVTKTFPQDNKRYPERYGEKQGYEYQEPGRYGGQRGHPQDMELRGHSFDDAKNIAISAEYKIGILVPLSGGAQKIGQSLLDAAQMAVMDNSQQKIALVPYDTKSTPQGASEAAGKAVTDGVDIIIGPLFSNSVRQIAPIAREANIPVIAFSNNKSVAGDGVYILGLMPNQQIKRLMDFANAEGISRYAAILPNDIYGHEVAKLVQAYSRDNSAQIIATEYYSSSKANYEEVAAKVAEKLMNLSHNGRTGILIPEGGEKLERLSIALNQNGVNLDNVKLLGTAYWDNRKTLSIPELDNAYYVSVPYRGRNSFEDKFYSYYGYEPDNVASLGYEAVELTINVAGQGFTPSALQDKMGYSGINGLYRLQADGVNERAYEVMEVRGGKIIVADPAKF